MRNRLRVARAEKNITQWRLAQELGSTTMRMHFIERERANPTPREIAKLAAFFEVPATALFPDYQEPTDDEDATDSATAS